MKTLPRRFVVLVSFLLSVVVARAIIGTGLQDQLGNPSGATADPANHTRFLIQRAQYSLDYNDTTREPNWVSWNLTTADVGSSGRSSFQVDTTLPAGFYQVLTTDYSGSGYDRGHLCPSGDRTVSVADNQFTFYMSNMMPQAPDNNQGVWASFETYCRTLANAGNEILIITGPSGFAGSTIASGVAIPGYTWKIAVVVPLGAGTAVSRIDADTRVIAIKVPNTAGVRSTPWQNFVTSAAQIQTDTGYTFFTALSSTIANALRIKVDGQTSTGAPVITQQPIAQSADVGGNATFSVTASSTTDPAFTYQWFKDDDDIAGATAATLTLTGVTGASAGNYTVVVTNSVGSVTSSAAALVVTGIAPSITANPPARTVSAGGAATFTVSAAGSPTLTYQWRKGTTNLTNGGNVTGATSATLTLSNVQASDAGNYNVVVTNSVNSATSADAALTVTPAAPTIVSQPAAQSITTGSTATFSVTATGTAPLAYVWRKGGTPLANGGAISGADTATLTITNAQPADGGDYSVVVSNGLNPDATSANATLTVSAASASSVVAWTFGAGAGTETPTPTSGLPSDVTGGTVTQNNNNGTTTMITTTSASSGYTGASGGNNAGAAARTGALNRNTSGSAFFQFTLTPASGKQLVVTALSFGSRSTSTGPQAYDIYTSVDNYAARIANGTLANNSSYALQSPTISTLTGATSTGITFRIYGYNGAGSASTNTANWRIDDLKVTVNTLVPAPSAPVVASTSPVNGATGVNGASPITVTFNQPVTVANGWFTMTSAATGAIAATVTGGPSAFTLTPPVNFTDNDTVTVTLVAAQITDAASGTLHPTANTAFSFTTAAPVAPSITTAPVAQTVNAGGTATFTVAASGTQPFSYQWRKGGVAITGNGSATTSTLTLANVQAADAADYDVVVSNGILPNATSTPVALTVTPAAPTITTHPVAATVLHGGNVSFTVAASGTQPFTYQWRKGATNLTNGAVAGGATISGATSVTLTLTGVTSADAGDYNVVVANGVTPTATSNNAALTVTLPPAGPTFGYTGSVYTQNFDTLPSTGTVTLNGSGNVVVALDAAAPAGVGASGMAGWSFSRYAGSNTTGSSAVAPPFAVNNGSSNSGNTYSYGATVTAPATNDRALGSLGSGSTVPRFGVAFVNNSTTTLTQVTIRYTGEQWRRGSAAANKLAFSYALGGHDLNIGSFTAVPELDFTAPVTTGSNAALDGNDPANRVLIAPLPLRGLSWAPGQTIVLRWTDVDDSGSDDGLAIDDFSFTAAPAIETQPIARTATVGDTVTFTVAASGTGPLSYQWHKNGDPLANGGVVGGAQTDTLTLTGITTADLAGYSCLVTNPAGSTASDSASLTVNQAAATVVLGNLAQTYNGTARAATATTTPGGLPVTFTYDGTGAAPTNAGSYAVVATVNHADYTGSASGTLVIAKATAPVALGGLAQTYNGAPRIATATTTPAGLAVALTYNGSATAPTNAGSYTVAATINDANYAGAATGTLVISPAPATVSLGNLNFVYDGNPKTISPTTQPAGLPVFITYNNTGFAPVNAGAYAVQASVNNPNYTGAATGSLVIVPAAQTIAFGAVPATINVGMAFTLAATASSGLPVTLAVASGNASLAGSSLTIHDTSPVTVRATQAGNSNLAAATADLALTAAKQAQTITFAALADRPGDAAPFTLSATASSNLPVSFSVVSGPATISGQTLTLAGTPGAVVVRASQAGNATFNAAPPVDRSFNVTAAPTAPVITTQPLPQTALIGANVTFTVVATGGTPNLAYQWRKDGSPIAGATSASLSLTSVAANAAGGYDVVVTNAVGATPSALARLTINVAAAAPIIARQPANRSLLIGSTATFSVVATGAPTPTFQWRKDGIAISGATSDTLTLANIGVADAGAYSVLVTNSAGSVPSRAATLTVLRRSFAGIYFGTIGNTAGTGEFALLINDDNTGVFLGYENVPGFLGDLPAGGTLPHTRVYVGRNVSVSDTGAFSFNVLGYTPPGVAVGGVNPPGQPPSISPLRISNFALAGTLSEAGALTGAFAGGPFLQGTRSPATGNAARYAGFYTAGASGSSAQLLAIVSPAGRAFVVVLSTQTASSAAFAASAGEAPVLEQARPAAAAFALTSGVGAVDANGRLTLAAGGQTLGGSLSADGATLSAALSNPTGTTNFSGFNATAAVAADQRVANISTRTTAGAADQPAIVGFVVTGLEVKTLLIRAVGPTLRNFGVNTAIAAPKLELMRTGTAAPLVSNTGWATSGNAAEISAAATRSGAFPLIANSADSAIVATLEPGSYTAVVTAADGRAGVTLVEVYDLSGGSPLQQLANLSTRATTGSGDATLIAGVVITGTAPKRVLLRAAGPALTQFGVSGALARPQLTLATLEGARVAQNAGWSASAEAAAIAEAAASVGAFAFGATSADAALLVNLAPGAYTATVTGLTGPNGVALIEVYDVP